jgi:hypothetical protein
MVAIESAIDMATHGEAPVCGMLEFAISIAGVIKTRLPVDL